MRTTSSKDSIATTSFEPKHFVLGTLSDYGGRFRYVDKKLQVDRYYPYERPLIDFIVKYIESELNIVVDTVIDKRGGKMFSKELSTILNGYYDEEGTLQSNKLMTKGQRCSYLAGVYYRYGEKLDTSIYKIQLANSPKHQNCYELLKQIGCERIFYKYLRNIPAQYILYFEPTDELKKYLEEIEPERLILKESFYNQIDELIQGHINRDEFRSELRKSKTEEVQKIKQAFER